MGKHQLKNQRGAALLTVLVALLLISLMTLELQYTSLIERKLAYNDLNQIQTHYLAKSGVNLGLLRLILYGKAKNTYGPEYNRYLNAIWSLPFPPYPPEAAALSKLSLQEKSSQEEMIKETRVSNGQFSYSLTSESSKLNLNLLAATADTLPPNFRERPKDLISYIGFNLLSRIENIFRESESPDEEFGNIKAEEVVYNIMDWVSPGNTSFGSSNKDSWYEQQVPPYKAKRARFFTLDELKLVKGMSPALYQKLRPIVTVFSEDGKTDLDVATSNGMLKQLYPDFTDRDLEEIRRTFQERGQTWGSVKTFTDFMQQRFARFNDRFPAASHKDFFTVGSESFLLKSQGVIKKSGTAIRSDISVAVVLGRPTVGTPVPNLTDPVQCEQTKENVWLGGRCVLAPQNATECRESGGRPCTDGTDGCVPLRDGGIGVCFPFKTAGAGGPRGRLSSVKIYSWVES